MYKQFFPPHRMLLGPGPSGVPASVLQALARPTVGHLDPLFLQCMDEVSAMLRVLFGTANPVTFAVAGTGMEGMQFCLTNLLEPGDTFAPCINGAFGGRMLDMAERLGANIHPIKTDWGKAFSLDQIVAELDANPTIKVLGIVHAETSTGVLQPLEGLGEECEKRGVPLVVDAVTSIGAHPINVDALKIDAAYAGTQKALACPPGLAPVTMGQRALEKVRQRKSKPASWYLDVSQLMSYYLAPTSGGRPYVHTAPINMLYALHEALRIATSKSEGQRLTEHRNAHDYLLAGLTEFGCELIPAPEDSLYTLNCVTPPPNFDEAVLRRMLLERHNIEIGAGIGAFAGKALRIGTMGPEGTNLQNVQHLLDAMRQVMR